MIPTMILRGGQTLPAIGIGTFGSDRYDAETIARAVRTGLDLGYRLIDCAAVYGNEDKIGAVLQQAWQAGYRRDEIQIISKVWNDHHGRGDVLRSCARSLKDLQLDYLDLYLVHWPFANYHPEGAPPDYLHPDAKPYCHEQFMATWFAMERLQQAGLVRQIGVSNMTIAKLRRLVQDCRIMPAVHEMELHPTFQQPDLYAYCRQLGILPIGYSPLGSPSRPQRDRTENDVSDLEHPVVCRIAERLNLHPAQVCLQWAAMRGHVTIPFSVRPEQLQANLAALDGPALTEDDMLELQSVDCDNRLIKGQVFLWQGARDWTDLWDIDQSERTWRS